MSVDNTPTGIVYTVTNGAAGQQYPLTFPYIKDDDVRAYYVHGGTQVTMSLGSGYSVSGQTFTASIALPAGAKLAIYRETDITQEILWVDGQAVYTPDIMQADDKLTFIVQEIAGDVKRAVKVSREEEAGGSTPGDLLAGIYTARDDAQSASSAAQAAKAAAGQSAAEAAASANTAAQTVQTATADAVSAATAQAHAAASSASAAAQSAIDAAAAVPENLVRRVETVEAKTNPATATVSGIGRIATPADNLPGADLSDGPAFIAAGSDAMHSFVPAFMLGALFPHTASASYVPLGCVPADGAQYTRAQFPTFYDQLLATGKLNICTYSQYAAQVATSGNCFKYALDATNKTFKVPLMKDGDSITQALSTSESGKSYKAGLPDITANFGTEGGHTAQVSGAAYRGPSGSVQAFPGAGTYSTQMFAASLSNPIYGKSNTVTDEQVRARWFVVIASAQSFTSVMDWSNYMTALDGKANNDLSNLGAGSGDVIRANTVLRRLSTRTSTGTWTITGVVIGRALVIGMGSTSTADNQYVVFRIISGSDIGTSGVPAGYVLGKGSGYVSAPSFVIKPTATTVVIEIPTFYSGGTLYAEQI